MKRLKTKLSLMLIAVLALSGTSSRAQQSSAVTTGGGSSQPQATLLIYGDRGGYPYPGGFWDGTTMAVPPLLSDSRLAPGQVIYHLVSDCHGYHAIEVYRHYRSYVQHYVIRYPFSPVSVYVTPSGVFYVPNRWRVGPSYRLAYR